METIIKRSNGGTAMRCFFCGGKVIWGCDYSFEDFMLDGDGIVSVHTCSECGATWEGYLPLEDEENSLS